MTAPRSDRLISLDAFRGLSIAAMILVNDPGSWDHVYPQLLHAEWIGWTFTDLIFPAFLFIVGVSMWYSFKKHQGETRIFLWRKSLLRAGLLFLVGLFISWFPFHSLSSDNLHYVGVLQRIAVSYLIAVFVCTSFSKKMIAATAALMLIAHWIVIVQIGGPSTYEREIFFSLGIDRLTFISCLASAVPVVCGYLAGSYIDRGDADPRMAASLIVAGVAIMLAGLIWSLQLPIIKSLLWSSSYVLFTVGTSIIAFGICFYLIDVKGNRKWATPLVHLGFNPLLIYVVSILLDKLTWLIEVGDGDSPVPIHTWIHQTVFRPLAGDMNGSLLYAMAFVVLHWLIAYGLYKQRMRISL
jgi:predicted acyltransferase